MKITAIQQQKKDKERVSVYVDDEYSFSMTMNNLVEHGLRTGQEITEKQIEEFAAEDEKEKAFAYIVFQLGYGLKTEKELIQKMQKKQYSDEAQYYALSKAKRFGYVNDVEYCEAFISQHKNVAGWGEKKIINELYRKGIPSKMVKEMLAQYYTDEEVEENAYRCALKKYESVSQRETDQRKIKQKLYAFLAGRGYNYNVIQTVINRIVECDDE